MPEPMTLATAMIALAQTELSSSALKALAKQIRSHDLGRQAEKFFTEVAKRLASVEDYRGLPPGLLTQLTLATAKVDSEELRSFWVELAVKGMTGTITDSEMRWAANVLERLVPADTVALALCLDRRIRMRKVGATNMSVVDAMHRLRVHGLVEFEDRSGLGNGPGGAPAFAGIAVNYEYRAGFRPGLVENVERATFGPGPSEHHVAVVGRWALTDLGAKFAHLCDVKPVDDHGEFSAMVVRMDAEYFRAF